MKQKTLVVKCPKCGFDIPIQSNDEILLLLDENRDFIKRVLSRSDKEWNKEEKEGLEKILDLMQRIGNLYK